MKPYSMLDKFEEFDVSSIESLKIDIQYLNVNTPKNWISDLDFYLGFRLL